MKIILALLAALVMVLGLAAAASPGNPRSPIAQMGPDKGLAEATMDAPVMPQFPQTAASPAPAKKFAVVIGIVYDNYDLGEVNYADQDAASVYNMLIEKWGFPRENIRLLRNSEATRQNILGALDWLAHNPDIGPDSDVVVFYSGHGLRSAPNTGLNIPGLDNAYALVPFDFRAFDYKKGQGLLWDSELTGYLGGIQAGRMWINIDSCSSGGFDRPGINGPNRIVTMSSQGDQLSSEIQETQRGAMVQFMIEEGINKGMTIEQAFDLAAPEVSRRYGQNPRIADNYPGNMDLSQSPQTPAA